MTDFNWVKARAECSLTAIFGALRLQLQQDVDERNALRKGPDYLYRFRLVVNGGSVLVMVEGSEVPSRDSVLFSLTDKAIEVSGDDKKVRLRATPTISHDCECRLLINGEEKELWHLRKMALEDFFFISSAGL